MDSVSARGYSERGIASACLRTSRCPATRKSSRNRLWPRKENSGRIDYPKPDSTSRLIASVSSASMITRGVIPIWWKKVSMLNRMLLRGG